MSRKFVPPKLDMGTGFAKASSIKAKHKSQSSGHSTPSSSKNSGTPSKISTASYKRSNKQQTLKDTIPLTLINLAQFFDWKRTSQQAPTLFKIASVIWLYLPNARLEEYSVNFSDAASNSVLEFAPKSPPVIATTSPKGEILIMVESMKKK
eukprot:180768_1